MFAEVADGGYLPSRVRLSKYLPLATDIEVNNSLSIYTKTMTSYRKKR